MPELVRGLPVGPVVPVPVLHAAVIWTVLAQGSKVEPLAGRVAAGQSAAQDGVASVSISVSVLWHVWPVSSVAGAGSAAVVAGVEAVVAADAHVAVAINPAAIAVVGLSV